MPRRLAMRPLSLRTATMKVMLRHPHQPGPTTAWNPSTKVPSATMRRRLSLPQQMVTTKALLQLLLTQTPMTGLPESRASLHSRRLFAQDEPPWLPSRRFTRQLSDERTNDGVERWLALTAAA